MPSSALTKTEVAERIIIKNIFIVFVVPFFYLSNLY
jgi:hypothetical protein